MDKIRIAFFAEILIEDFDGASRTMFQLIKRIDKSRFEFIFFCGVGPKELFGFPCIVVPSFTLPVNRNYKMALPFLAGKKLNDCLKAFGPQVVHIATPSLLGQFAVRYAGKCQLPVITIYHTHFISYIAYYFKAIPFLIKPVKARVAVSQRVFYNKCDLMYIPSESIASEMIGYGVQTGRIKIWKRGIDTTLFSPQKRNVSWIQSLTGNTQKNILFASRLVWEKNLDTLFRIYDGIVAQNLPYNLVIAGDGLALEACKKYMKKAVFTGKLNHEMLAQLYASTDVFLFTSVSETYGNVVLEAMASGLPCVIADGGGSADFIQDGINGFKCSPFSEAGYVNKLRQVLHNPLQAEQFAQQGLQSSQKLNWNTLASEYFSDVTNLALGRDHKTISTP